MRKSLLFVAVLLATTSIFLIATDQNLVGHWTFEAGTDYKEARIYDGVLTESQINDIINPAQVPTLSQWDLIVLVLLLLIFAGAVFKQKRISTINLDSL